MLLYQKVLLKSFNRFSIDVVTNINVGTAQKSFDGSQQGPAQGCSEMLQIDTKNHEVGAFFRFAGHANIAGKGDPVWNVAGRNLCSAMQGGCLLICESCNRHF